MAQTLISSEVDFKAEGKHSGYLRLPHSVHQSAYGWIPVPVVSIKNGDGPRVLMLAGIHGDEYEGQIALSKLAEELDHANICGQVILLAQANYPAAQAGLRTSPIDNGNLNRSFPGNAFGSPTEMIADYIENTLLPMADIMIDLHSGGSSLFYSPTLLRGQGISEKETNALVGLQGAFDLPNAWVFTGVGGPNSTARTSMGAANRKGVVSVMAELGGGGTVTPDILRQTERGLRRILGHLGILPNYKADASQGTKELSVVGSIFAYVAGVFEPTKEIGDIVEKNDLTGYVHFPDQPGQHAKELLSPFDGMVLCKRALGRVVKGDTVFQIATEAKL